VLLSLILYIESEMSQTQDQIIAFNNCKRMNLSYRSLSVEYFDKILIIKFNRPKVYNALDQRAFFELMRALGEASNNPNITIVVLTGVGMYFTAGKDLKERNTSLTEEEDTRSRNYVLRTLTKTIINCTKVIVAIVNGPAIGVGFTLCGLCDIVYCTESASFEAPFVSLGICAEACSSYTFPFIMGKSKAMEVLYFGHKLTAEEAYRFNFVSKVFKDDQDVEKNLWPKLIENSRLSAFTLYKNKKLITQQQREILYTALEQELQLIKNLRVGDEHKRILAEFQEKRSKPKSKL